MSESSDKKELLRQFAQALFSVPPEGHRVPVDRSRVGSLYPMCQVVLKPTVVGLVDVAIPVAPPKSGDVGGDHNEAA